MEICRPYPTHATGFRNGQHLRLSDGFQKMEKEREVGQSKPGRALSRVILRKSARSAGVHGVRIIASDV